MTHIGGQSRGKFSYSWGTAGTDFEAEACFPLTCGQFKLSYKQISPPRPKHANGSAPNLNREISSSSFTHKIPIPPFQRRSRSRIIRLCSSLPLNILNQPFAALATCHDVTLVPIWGRGSLGLFYANGKKQSPAQRTREQLLIQTMSSQCRICRITTNTPRPSEHLQVDISACPFLLFLCFLDCNLYIKAETIMYLLSSPYTHWPFKKHQWNEGMNDIVHICKQLCYPLQTSGLEILQLACITGQELALVCEGNGVKRTER